MTRIGTVLLVALAVVGLGVANGSSGDEASLTVSQHMDLNTAVSGGAGSEVVTTSPSASGPGAPAAAAPASTPDAPPPTSAATSAGAAGEAVLDPALLPPLTQGVRVLKTLPTSRQVVNLTFDVEGAPAPATAILDTLKAEGVKGSFGLTGTFIQTHPDVVRRMASEGHDIFNHTYSHPSLPVIGPLLRRGQLRNMENALLGILDRKPVPVFRPPYGKFNSVVLQDIAAMGYPWVLLWDVDAQGFRGFSPAHIANTALKQAKAGSIILMHGIPQDAAALPVLIRGLKERGLGFVTVSQALGLK